MAATFDSGHALLIAVDQNAVARWALPEVVNDVQALARVLTDPDRCGYKSSNVRILDGGAATKKGILDALKKFQESIDKDVSGNVTAVLYYSGHGWLDKSDMPPNYYLLPYNVDEENLQSTSLLARDFAAAVAALRPQRLFAALDCCHAAGMEAKDILRGESVAIPVSMLASEGYAVGPTNGAKGLESLGFGAGRAVLASSQGTQLSYIKKDRTMSVFTYHLVEALTGHAGPAAGATEVLVSDVMGHVSRRVPDTVRRETGKRQDPDYHVSGNFPVALLLGGKGLQPGTVLPEPVAGRFENEYQQLPIPSGGSLIRHRSVPVPSVEEVGSAIEDIQAIDKQLRDNKEVRGRDDRASLDAVARRLLSWKKRVRELGFRDVSRVESSPRLLDEYDELREDIARCKGIVSRYLRERQTS